MDLKKSSVFICILWAVIILVWIVFNEIILHTGREVLLKTVPVDPRDLLMGDYVILNYEIGQLPKDYKFDNNKEVYVTLDIDKDNVGSISGISFIKPQNGVFLKGKMSKCNTIIPFWKNGQCISYGIESYYVKEHTGHDLENNLRQGTLVKVSVGKNGHAKVKGFIK